MSNYSAGKVMSQLPTPSTAVCEAADHALLRGLSLTPNQMRFVFEYTKDFDPKAAAIRIGVTSKNASVTAAKYLGRKDVTRAIQRIAKAEMEARALSSKQVLDELAAIALSNIDDVVKVENGVVTVKKWEEIPLHVKGCIQEIANVKDADGTIGIKVKLYSKPEALKMLAMYFGLLVNRVEHTGPEGGPIPIYRVTDEDLEQIILKGMDNHGEETKQ